MVCMFFLMKPTKGSLNNIGMISLDMMNINAKREERYFYLLLIGLKKRAVKPSLIFVEYVGLVFFSTIWISASLIFLKG